jgi:signal transduction histidine kinase/CheY-like chemotaxis protein
MTLKRKIHVILSLAFGTLSLIAATLVSAIHFGFVPGVSMLSAAATSLLVGSVIVISGCIVCAIASKMIANALSQPIDQLAGVMQTIAATNNLALRVPESATADLSGLVASINKLLNATEEAQNDMLKARYEVESANKGKSLFIAKVSHELRTPIHSITGMLRILLKQESAPGKRQYIQMAQDSALALLETINEILDFSKMQNGELSIEQESFSLTEVVRSTVEHLIPRFEEKQSLELCWDIHPDVPESVVGDAARIRNILINLLGNAFKFTEQGHVKLQVSRYDTGKSTEAGVRFEVRDTGIGISTNKLSTIFDPFTTADEGSARLYAGTGLGLAIVKQIAERMGGTIAATSSLGEGSMFAVELPFDLQTSVPIEIDLPTDQRPVAVFASPGVRPDAVASGLRRFGRDVNVISADDPTQLDFMIANAASFSIIHIIKSPDILFDELAPLLRVAAQHDVPVVLSVPSAEVSSTDYLMRSDTFTIALRPTSALDVLLIASGKLKPNTSIREFEETSEKAPQRLNIVIADDAKTNRIILKTLLEEAGHSVEVVENGKQLLERITPKSRAGRSETDHIDLVLTDIQMPVMDGLTATQNFREWERQASPSRKLPIVAVTSYAFPDECSKMLASGVDHILTKPISPKRLSRLISQITYEVSSSDNDDPTSQSDRDIIEELCQLTENVALRVSELSAMLEHIAPESIRPIVDIAGVFERSGDSLRRTGLILSGFIESYEEPLAALESTPLPVEDAQTFRRMAHSLKGLLLDAGAQPAANLAANLESCAVDNPSAITMTMVQELAVATREAAEVLKEIASALPSLELYSALPAMEEALTLH